VCLTLKYSVLISQRVKWQVYNMYNSGNNMNRPVKVTGL